MNHAQRTIVLLLALAATSVSMPAAAQSSDAEPSMQGDLDRFWAEQRRVRVLQRRQYSTDGDFQATLFIGGVPNDPFFNYYPIGLRFGYHLSEPIAIEASGSYLLTARTDLKQLLEDNDATIFLVDQQVWRANAAVLWAPLYGKFSLLGTKLANFDWYVGAGVGVLGTLHEGDEGSLGTEQSEIKPEVTILTGWNLHLSQRFALRLDYRQGIYQAKIGGVSYPSELSLGGSVFF